MKGHNYDHGKNDICKKCGKSHINPKGNLGNKFSFKRTSPTWNKGLTKETDKRLVEYGQKIARTKKGVSIYPDGRPPFSEEWKKNMPTKFKKGCIPWNKGLTKETNERVLNYSKKLLGRKPSNPNVFNEWRKKNNIIQTYPKLEYIEELGHAVRSSWEKEFGLMLKRNGIDYSYESKTFSIMDHNKKRRYTPDFLIKDIFVETKGFIRPYKVRILKLLKEQYPDIKLLVVGLDRCSNYEIPFNVIPWENREETLKMLSVE